MVQLAGVCPADIVEHVPFNDEIVTVGIRVQPIESVQGRGDAVGDIFKPVSPQRDVVSGVGFTVFALFDCFSLPAWL